MRKLYSTGKIYIASALLYLEDSVPAFRVKLGANDLNCVDVPLNPTHSLTLANIQKICYEYTNIIHLSYLIGIN